MDRMLSFGSTGADVAEMQALLNSHTPTFLPKLAVDKIFGPKTLARVKEFQRNNNLQVDGIVGPNTWAALREEEPEIQPRSGLNCGNSDPANQNRAIGVRNAVVFGLAGQGGGAPVQLASFSGGGLSSLISLPGLPTVRPLTAAQIITATGVYGTSLDFSRIFISDQTGAGNRPFTVGIPATPLSSAMQIMNCGTLTPSTNDLIHELAHVWQSQHHSSVTAFMTNAVGSQAAAVAASGAEALTNPAVRSDPDFPVHFPFSAYAFVPGKPFGEYAAEQIANAVEHGVTAIVAHVKAVAANAVDADNQTSLATMRIGDRRTPGTIF